MKLRISDLWNWRDPINRGPYLAWGLLLTLAKYLLDRQALHYFSNWAWHPWSYWLPGDVLGVLSKAPERQRAAQVLLAIALPFVYVGVALTYRRLRSVGWSPGLIVLFFVPVVNLILFAVLSCVPEARAPEPVDVSEARRAYQAKERRRDLVSSLVPRSKLGSALAAIVLTGLIAVGIMFLFVEVFQRYAWGIFLGVPFALGLFSTMIYCLHEPRRIGACLAVGYLAVLVAEGVLFAISWEGAVCLLMATPLTFSISSIGSLVGHQIVKARASDPKYRRLMGVVVALLPLLLGAEAVQTPDVHVVTVRDEVALDASPEAVWNQIHTIDHIEASRPFLVWLGLPEPIRCELERPELGARRVCYFRQGTIEERVAEWDPPRRVRLEIVHSTLPGRHWLGFRDAVYEVRTEGGRTVLGRTTSYTSTLEPRLYWEIPEAMGIRSEHSYIFAELKRRLQ